MITGAQEDALRLLFPIDEPNRTPVQQGASMVAFALNVALDLADGDRDAESWIVAVAERVCARRAAGFVADEADRILREAA